MMLSKYGALAILLLPFESYLKGPQITGADVIEIPDSHTAT